MAVLKLTQVTIPVNERVHWKTKKDITKEPKLLPHKTKQDFFPYHYSKNNYN